MSSLPMKLSAIAMLAIIWVAFVNQVTAATEKALYLPDKVDRVPDKNDYDSDASEYSFKRMVQGDNVAIFWHKEYGDDPMTNANERRRFDVNYMTS